jgi:hypothetical protein
MYLIPWLSLILLIELSLAWKETTVWGCAVLCAYKSGGHINGGRMSNRA